MNNDDLLTQQAELARRRAGLDSERKYIEDVRGNKGSNVLDVLGAIIRGRQVKSGEEAYAKDAAAARSDYSQRLGTEMNSYIDGMQGKPQGDFAADGYGPQTPPEAPNPRRAITQAMLSQLPEVQALGKAGMAGLGKQSDEKFGHTPTVMRDAQGKNVSVLTGDRGTTKQIEGFEPVTEEYGPIGPMGTDANGKPVIGQADLKSHKVRWMPPGQTINIDNVGNKEAIGLSGKVMEKSRDALLEGQKNFDASSRLYQLADDPEVLTGFGAGVGTGLANIGAKFGFGGASSATKTQALLAEMAQQTLSAGQTMKGSFSNSDLLFLKEASSGNAEFTAAAIKRAAALSMAASHNAILANHQQLEAAKSIPGVEQIGALYPTPQIGHSLPFDTDAGFKADDRTGKVRYVGSGTFTPRTAGIPKPKNGAISFDDFMNGGQ